MYPTGARRSIRQANEYRPRPFALENLGPYASAPPQKMYESFGGPFSTQTLQSAGTSSGRGSQTTNYIPQNDGRPSISVQQESLQELEAAIDMPPAYAVDVQRERVTI